MDGRFISPLMAKAKHVVEHFKKSGKSTTLLRKAQRALGWKDSEFLELNQSSETRWTSAHAILKRLVLLSDAVHKVLSESNKKELREIDLPASVIYQLHEVADTLKPLCTVIQGIGSENYMSMSIVEPILSKLMRKTLVAKDADTPAIHELKTDALKNLNPLTARHFFFTLSFGAGQIFSFLIPGAG